MGLVVPSIDTEETGDGRIIHVIGCSTGAKDQLRIYLDRGDNPSVSFHVEDENGEMSPEVFVNQDTLPALIHLLQSMIRKEPA